MRRQVKWVSNDRRYGFITEEAGHDYYFSVPDVVGAQLPHGGEMVEFEGLCTARGLRAQKVRVVSPSTAGQSRDDRDTCRHCVCRIYATNLEFATDRW